MAASKKGGGSKGKRGGAAKESKAPASKAEGASASAAKSGGDAGSGKFTSKMAFIKAHPGLSPGEVAEKGKAAGFLFDPKYVSTVRSIERKKAGAPPRRRGRKPGSTAAAAAPRAAKAGGKQSKADFVRGLPFDMPVAEVVKKAAAAGITLTGAHVHTIRTAERAKARKGGGAAHAAPAAAPAAAKAAAGKAAGKAAASGGVVERELAALVLNHGFKAVATALEGVKQRLASLL